MKKLTLNLDTLQVQSFETTAAMASHGTVRGHTGETDCTCDLSLCQTCGEPSCETCPAQYCNQVTEAQSCGVGCTLTGSLSACTNCGTADCTGNAGDMFCYDSMHYCLPTRNQPTCIKCLG